jgi:hypothetical protein
MDRFMYSSKIIRTDGARMIDRWIDGLGEDNTCIDENNRYLLDLIIEKLNLRGVACVKENLFTLISPSNQASCQTKLLLHSTRCHMFHSMH